MAGNMLATAGRMPALPNIVERELPEHHSSRQTKGSASMLLAGAGILLARPPRSLISGSNRKLFAHFRGHADWPAGLRVYRAPERPSL